MPAATGTDPLHPDNASTAAEGRGDTVVVVELHGQLDGVAGSELDGLLSTLAAVPYPVVLDVSEAWAQTRAGLRRLCQFRAMRHAAGLGCRLSGLHPRIIVDLDKADLGEVFAVWADTHFPGRQ